MKHTRIFLRSIFLTATFFCFFFTINGFAESIDGPFYGFSSDTTYEEIARGYKDQISSRDTDEIIVDGVDILGLTGEYLFEFSQGKLSKCTFTPDHGEYEDENELTDELTTQRQVFVDYFDNEYGTYTEYEWSYRFEWDTKYGNGWMEWFSDNYYTVFRWINYQGNPILIVTDSGSNFAGLAFLADTPEFDVIICYNETAYQKTLDKYTKNQVTKHAK